MKKGKLGYRIIALLMAAFLLFSMDGVMTFAETVSGNEMQEQSGEERILQMEANSAFGKLSLGEMHGATITEDGSLYIWGDNYYGQLGDGTNKNGRIYPPTKIMDNATTVSLGYRHSAAITENGSLYIWGQNDSGELGDGTTTHHHTPTKVMDSVEMVSLGLYYSAAITEDGSLYTWGANYYGNLGDGTTTNRYAPTKIMDNVAMVSLGYYHSAAITEDGSLYTWGCNESGQLGDGTATDHYMPTKIMDNVAMVSLGLYYSAAITEDGSLYTWGSNYRGSLGDGTNKNVNIKTPTKIMDNVAMVSLGDYHGAAITEDGSLYTWGYNEYGQLGDGTTTDRYIPTKIMDNVAMVSLGELHSAAITENGSLYTWGRNMQGSLGDGTTTDRYTPTPISISNPSTTEDPDAIPDGPTTWVGQTGTEGFVNRLYNVALTRDSETEGFNDWNQKLKSKTKTAAEVAQGFIFSEEFKNKEYNDVQFVKILYRTMFGREADEGGLADWLDALENGMSREYVYHGFAESQEFTNLCEDYDVVRGEVSLSAYRDKNKGATGFIARLYTKMLGRKFEDDGIEYWCEEYLTGRRSIESIATDGFLHSEEFTNQNLSNEEFVTRMYETFLNREPEEAGLKDWVNRLETGEVTRDSLVYGFTNSVEFSKIKAEYGL